MSRIWVVLFLLIPISLFSQIGGEYSYALLDLQSSARVISMGGELISVIDNDVDLVRNNPGLLNPTMNKQISFNFVDYFSDINIVSVNYAIQSKQLGSVYFGIEGLNYGNFKETDAVGNVLGQFTANEQIISIGTSKQLYHKLRIGLSVHLINSRLEKYSSFGISTNLGLVYYNDIKMLCMSLLAKNFGRQLKSYTSTKESLPSQLQIGISKELQHLPFRFSFVVHHLDQFDISNSYLEPYIIDPITGDQELYTESIARILLRHIIVGGELNPGKKNFFLRGGFNFQRRWDMQVKSKVSMVGFSWGVGFRLSKFQLNYSRSNYHLAGSPNFFSFSTNMSLFGL